MTSSGGGEPPLVRSRSGEVAGVRRYHAELDEHRLRDYLMTKAAGETRAPAPRRTPPTLKVN